MPKCYQCSALFPNHIRIGDRLHNLQRRRFCLDCSPFGQHNTRDLCAPPKPALAIPSTEARCSRCKQTLPVDHFYMRRDGKALSRYCKVCTNQQTITRQQELKRMAVEYKGGQCQHCGYNRYLGALDFHHADGSRKGFDVSHGKCTSFEKIKHELDKCVLLCANCHREEHARLKGIIVPPPQKQKI